MKRRHNPFRNKIELSKGKVIKTRRFKYIAESIIDQDGNKCSKCALDKKRFECRKMKCRYIDRALLFKDFILKQIE
jgi:hypothetical protein